MRLSDETCEFIKGEVTALFEKCDVRCIPINGFELAMQMWINLIPYSSLNDQKRAAAMKLSPDGFFMESKDGQELIFYNDSIGYKRANMTILHEIGHCVLDHQSGTVEEEKEANFFAKYAAAPPPLVHRIKPHSPEEIADVFDLSYEASVNALNYYHKWLRYGSADYTSYEIRLLRLFSPVQEVM